jgi:uncharacterized protein
MNKKLTFLLALTFLFLFSGSVYGDDFLDGMDAEKRKDYKEALRLYRLSAEQGNPFGQHGLGQMYNLGRGVPQDYKEALKWYRLSAEQGNVFGQYNLGFMFQNGHGVPQDYKEAVKWYRLSAEQGYAQAQYYMGEMYANGQGVPQDYVSAHMWWNLAGSNGEKYAIRKRNRIERKMSPLQIEKAQDMVRNWKPKQERSLFEKFKEKFGIK